MNSTTTLNEIAICTVTVSNAAGEALHRNSMAVPEASGRDFFDVCARVRAVHTFDRSKTNAASCKLVWGGLDGDVWMVRELDFLGVDWLATVELWNRFADLERLVKTQGTMLREYEQCPSTFRGNEAARVAAVMDALSS